MGTGPCPGQSRPAVNKRKTRKPTVDQKTRCDWQTDSASVPCQCQDVAPDSLQPCNYIGATTGGHGQRGWDMPQLKGPNRKFVLSRTSPQGSLLPMCNFSKALRNVLRGCFCLVLLISAAWALGQRVGFQWNMCFTAWKWALVGRVNSSIRGGRPKPLIAIKECWSRKQ